MLTAEALATLRSGCVPGALWPDLLTEWHGPIVWQLNDGPWRRGVWGPIGPSSEVERLGVVKAGDMRPDPVVRLDLSRPEVRAHVARVMAAGLDGVRPPAPAWHILPSGETATPLPPEWAPHAPALLACHVARVVAGLGGVLHVMNPYPAGGYAARGAVYADAFVRAPDGWIVLIGHTKIAGGPQCGEEGARLCVAAAVKAGFAVLTPDGPVLPWPNPGGPDAR